VKRVALFLILFLFASAAVFAAAPLKIENGKEVTLTYKLSVKGTLLEAADPSEPFIYTHGKKMIVRGLEKELGGLKVGDRKTILVLPEEGYGLVNPKAFLEVSKEKLPPEVTVEKGIWLEARDPKGVPQLVRISEVKEKTVTLDFNHPLAGKELEFQIEVLSIK
jgi:FKBP-type peptidyl-prolyl cis-trans isomerase 2